MNFVRYQRKSYLQIVGTDRFFKIWFTVDICVNSAVEVVIVDQKNSVQLYEIILKLHNSTNKNYSKFTVFVGSDVVEIKL